MITRILHTPDVVTEDVEILPALMEQAVLVTTAIQLTQVVFTTDAETLPATIIQV